jgi:hypothetical protein
MTRANARPPVLVPDIQAVDWEARETRRDGNVPGPVLKILSRDPQTGAQTRLLHLPPGWHDEQLDWHPTSEEGLRLAGRLWMGGELLGEGFYLYRPKGILHGPVLADPLVGMTSINRMDGEPRIFRYRGTELPHRHAQPITDDWRASPFTWHEKLDTNSLSWEPIKRGPWEGASCKWLNRNRDTGGGAVLLDLPPRWSGRGAPARGQVEEFVVDGTIVAGGVEFGRWGYALRPAAAPAGGYEAPEGTRLICWWERDETE